MQNFQLMSKVIILSATRTQHWVSDSIEKTFDLIDQLNFSICDWCAESVWGVFAEWQLLVNYSTAKLERNMFGFSRANSCGIPNCINYMHWHDAVQWCVEQRRLNFSLVRMHFVFPFQLFLFFGFAVWLMFCGDNKRGMMMVLRVRAQKVKK